MFSFVQESHRASVSKALGQVLKGKTKVVWNSLDLKEQSSKPIRPPALYKTLASEVTWRKRSLVAGRIRESISQSSCLCSQHVPGTANHSVGPSQELAYLIIFNCSWEIAKFLPHRCLINVCRIKVLVQVSLLVQKSEKKKKMWDRVCYFNQKMGVK